VNSIKPSSKAKYFLFIGSLFIVTVLSGVNNSSMGILTDEGIQSSKLLIGEPRTVRSDEFLRGSPTGLGQLQGASGLTPFDAAFSSASETGVTETISIQKLIRIDSLAIDQIATALPVQMGFSLYNWLGVLYLLVFLPLFLNLIGIRWIPAILTSVTVLLSPVTQWWSQTPLAPVYNSAAACYFILLALKTRNQPNLSFRNTKTILAVIASLMFFARLPFTYQPWSIPVALFFISISLGYVVSKGATKSDKRILSSAVVLAATLVFTQLWLSREVFLTFFETIYPGTRRSGGMASVPTWSGNLSWALQYVNQGQLTSSNQSELSLGLLVLFPFVIGITPFIARTRFEIKQNLVLISGISILSVYFLWILAPLPARLNQINPLKFFPPDRVQQIFGLLVIILFAIFIERLFESSAFTQSSHFKPAVVSSSVLAFMLTLPSNIQFLGYFTGTQVITLWKVWASSIGIVLLVALVIYRHKSAFAIVPLILFSLFSSIGINPLYVGIGDIYESPIAREIRVSDQVQPGYWATDNIFSDSLLLANAVDHISGQQDTGPNLDTWRKVDPDNNFIEYWNRGASYVTFGWATDGVPVNILNPSPDIILVQIDPCGNEAKNLNLSWIISSAELNGTCLRLNFEGMWMESGKKIYRVNN
jgi:hypothetical protein